MPGFLCVLRDRRLEKLPLTIQETRKARKDAMPHERGLMPLLLSEFSILALADPNARYAARPLGGTPSAYRIPPNLLALKYLLIRPMPAAEVPDPLRPTVFLLVACSMPKVVARIPSHGRTK